MPNVCGSSLIPSPYVKDAFHRRVIEGDMKAVNPECRGTKAAPLYVLDVPGGGEASVELVLSSKARPIRLPRRRRSWKRGMPRPTPFMTGSFPARPAEDQRIFRQALPG